ncbi:hypothetical protein ACWDUC_14015 [Streptomyces tricolor]|uniref:hypothetical protein n=1 Tax=unclassified Streptomyces TaxID=2593676 RepID=UPI000B964A90|nr:MULTISPECIES: hypothetical protein [unclassified Streptomyces]OYP14084.1 hypothetical protein CFC35_05830 [Streptomyces sp. FBKL.4005]BCM70850.1 hypothetical protein EASAB2608_06184 [Streptomyces sp. EAS-AB2608]
MAEAYPTPLAGQRITATLLRSMQPLVARKTADTQRAATTTTTADPHLTFDVAAGAVYIMDGIIKYDGPAAADLNLDWSAPTGSLGEWYGWGAGHSPVISWNNTPAMVTDSQQARGYPIRTETNDITSARSFGCLGTGGTPLTVALWGTLRVGSTAGTYSLDWAQLVSDATAVTLYTDSWIRLQRIA